ncbi:hypothetical protein NBRC116494_23410 [Aurantivibrio plasticivorans]
MSENVENKKIVKTLEEAKERLKKANKTIIATNTQKAKNRRGY